MAPTRPQSCAHKRLYTGVSPHATEAGYVYPSIEERLSEASHSKQPSNYTAPEDIPSSLTFPAPLVLPGDDIAEDPKQDPDGLRSFALRKGRNRVTSTRSTLYVIEAPTVSNEVSFMNAWLEPKVPPEYPPPPGLPSNLTRPVASDIAAYLEAFYHGLSIKTLKSHYTFVTWPTAQPSSSGSYVGLADPSGDCTRIRHRPSPDAVSHQLNLGDLLDALLAAPLPEDAYAVMLLTHHDTYESPSDDFCCGRAYGASRICLVSSFRYNPALDAHNDVDRSHAWPASHCAWWIEAVCDHEGETSESATPAEGGLRAAVLAARSGMVPRGKGGWSAVWLASVCRTASHELGHCLGLAHCALYACVMQSTAGVGEDGRQPPYLCPVCLAKTAYAVVGEAVKGRGKEKVVEMERREKVWMVERYRRIQTYSAQWKGTGTGMLKGYGAWAGHRVKELAERQS
ncbi:conserved hypothetical protein [Verticillium alfalfae VaMs.102]|uniref:Archaemetzincin-2 n=1 Tax=Verticillium alfalfae (strain VaMs.102 / ATCC MYA-4576 / FGSC 10136) TaxID=526221 RepID=C9SCP3_VERA1|nr:conserved hypothetical protein [Verticillium alfalfae VaMs.102]EEY16858.1 conserved hypothetical protein [Verticillium alfalfae VaMs.102]